MPYRQEWVDPEVFVKHRGVTIYCTYKNDDCENNPASDYHFTLDREGSIDDGSFDVRDLPGWKDCPHPPYVTGEDDTPENHALWQEWHDNDTQAKHITEFLRRMIDYFEALSQKGGA